MQGFSSSRRLLVSILALACLLAVALGFAFVSSQSYAARSKQTYISLSGSFISAPMGARLSGAHASNQQLTITLALQSSQTTQMNNLLTALYTPGSSQYHQWLKQGDFNRLFAPSVSEQAAVRTLLEQAGLKIVSTPSPFLVRATGTTAQVETAFHTQIKDYMMANGQSFFQNDSAVQLPTTLSGLVMGVSGLSNASREHPNYITTSAAAQMQGKATPQYGGAPGGSGLTPSQTSSLYDANPVYQLGNRGKGQGATLAVFELSGYTESDIATYEHQFFGPAENVPLVNINVDGGPITPVCPKGDTCTPANNFAGDIEVAADIEMQIAISPKISHILVYNAPNDTLGITSADEYFKIANDNLADSISSSWGLCERDGSRGLFAAKSIAFTQMALQGQSMFSSSGDTGAFDCLRSSKFTGLNVDDPSSQPLVTAVGGTSFSIFDPGSTLSPLYPTGFETVWNVLNLCSSQKPTTCAVGATGGGVSTIWPRPSYQSGPGVTSSFSQKAPFCALATPSQFCRETPDVSANADAFTPYAAFCTGNPKTNSACATISAKQPVPGFFGIGGTSLSSPLWSGVIALWDSVHGERFGNANQGLYQLFRSHNAYTKFFHDITGIHQTENNNGFYPVTPNYDMATGIGTPIIAGIVAARF